MSEDLWFDRPDALDLVPEMSGRNNYIASALRDLVVDGFTVLKGVQPKEQCDRFCSEYEQFLDENPDLVESARDGLGRRHRLVNFHLYSEHGMKIAKNPEVVAVLQAFFREKAAVYTSLTFFQSTEQSMHRDCPHFCTFPEDLFVGVWTAMEDIHEDAGPLSYVPGSHRFQLNRFEFMERAMAETNDKRAAIELALHDYTAEAGRRGAEAGPIKYECLAKGDTAIWHPRLVHGGSPVRDRARTRKSMVVHCCPESKYVFQSDTFFGWPDPVVSPPPRYEYAESFGFKHLIDNMGPAFAPHA